MTPPNDSRRRLLPESILVCLAGKFSRRGHPFFWIGEGQERSCETDRGGEGNEIVQPTEEVFDPTNVLEEGINSNLLVLQLN